MIPRFKPYLDHSELQAAFQILPDAVQMFENQFAQLAGTGFALAFPYGRSAIWAFLEAMGLKNVEILQPAYTCVVVGHATVLSGNIPHFVDICLDNYNMDLEQVEKTINEKTGMIIATHLFGCPMDIDTLAQIVQQAEKRYGHKIWVMQDCAHSFGASWQGKLVSSAPDIAVFGLNISKILTSIFGGMLATNDPELASRLRLWRDTHFFHSSGLKSFRRLLYLLATYAAFNETIYGLVNWLQEDTSLLNYWTKAYHLDDKIHFPPDFREKMLPIEAMVGLTQLKKYPNILKQRRENARSYMQSVQAAPDFILPPDYDGSTYSHFAVRVEDRHKYILALRKGGIQAGELIDYSVPHLTAYRPYVNNHEFANSLYCSQHMINLPVHPGLSPEQREFVSKLINSCTSSRN